MRAYRRFLPVLLILALTAFLIVFARPNGPDLKVGKWTRELRLHKGLDLVGGSHLVYQLDTSKFNGNKDEALNQVLEIMRLRVDGLGVSEPVLQKTTVGTEPAIIVELPGIDDTTRARDVIGQTASLTFFTQDGTPVLTGADVDQASVVFDQTTNKPQVQLKFKDSGTKAFDTATKNNIGQPIYIVLDNALVSSPVVQEEIPNGVATITGIGQGKSLVEATADVRQLARQINSGALPVPVSLVEEQTVGATLGGQAVRTTITAGLVGFVAISLFLIIVFGLAGLVAVFALFVYGLLMIFFIQFIPITLTLAGIAALILSFGSAVDANILSFSRIREELRHESNPVLAVRQGFDRAWSSIRDSNLASVIISLVLLWFGTGPIRGFALILLLGIAVAIFTALVISRQLLMWLARTKIGKKLISL